VGKRQLAKQAGVNNIDLYQVFSFSFTLWNDRDILARLKNNQLKNIARLKT